MATNADFEKSSQMRDFRPLRHSITSSICWHQLSKHSVYSVAHHSLHFERRLCHAYLESLWSIWTPYWVVLHTIEVNCHRHGNLIRHIAHGYRGMETAHKFASISADFNAMYALVNSPIIESKPSISALFEGCDYIFSGTEPPAVMTVILVFVMACWVQIVIGMWGWYIKHTWKTKICDCSKKFEILITTAIAGACLVPSLAYPTNLTLNFKNTDRAHWLWDLPLLSTAFQSYWLAETSHSPPASPRETAVRWHSNMKSFRPHHIVWTNKSRHTRLMARRLWNSYQYSIGDVYHYCVLVWIWLETLGGVLNEFTCNLWMLMSAALIPGKKGGEMPKRWTLPRNEHLAQNLYGIATRAFVPSKTIKQEEKVQKHNKLVNDKISRFKRVSRVFASSHHHQNLERIGYSAPPMAEETIRWCGHAAAPAIRLIRGI